MKEIDKLFNQVSNESTGQGFKQIFFDIIDFCKQKQDPKQLQSSQQVNSAHLLQIYWQIKKFQIYLAINNALQRFNKDQEIQQIFMELFQQSLDYQHDFELLLLILQNIEKKYLELLKEILNVWTQEKLKVFYQRLKHVPQIIKATSLDFYLNLISIQKFFELKITYKHFELLWAGFGAFIQSNILLSVQIMSQSIDQFEYQLLMTLYQSVFSKSSKHEEKKSQEEKQLKKYQGALIPILESQTENIKAKGVQLVFEFFNLNPNFNFNQKFQFLKYFLQDEFFYVRKLSQIFLGQMIRNEAKQIQDQENVSYIKKIFLLSLQDPSHQIRILNYQLLSLEKFLKLFDDNEILLMIEKLDRKFIDQKIMPFEREKILRAFNVILSNKKSIENQKENFYQYKQYFSLVDVYQQHKTQINSNRDLVQIIFYPKEIQSHQIKKVQKKNILKQFLIGNIDQGKFNRSILSKYEIELKDFIVFINNINRENNSIKFQLFLIEIIQQNLEHFINIFEFLNKKNKDIESNFNYVKSILNKDNSTDKIQSNNTIKYNTQQNKDLWLKTKFYLLQNYCIKTVMENRLLFQLINPIFKELLFMQIKHQNNIYYKEIKSTLIGDDLYYYIDNSDNLTNIKVALCIQIQTNPLQQIKITHYIKCCKSPNT